MNKEGLHHNVETIMVTKLEIPLFIICKQVQ